MISEKIDEFDTSFLKVKLEPIEQKGKKFHIAKMKANHFLHLYTVEPAKYDIAKQTALASRFTDDKDYYNFLIKKDKNRLKKEPFERPDSKERIREIKDFLNREEYAFFPNTIIVTCDLINYSFMFPDDKIFSDLNNDEVDFLKESKLSFLEKSESETILYIPYQEDSLVIIDGQHRVKGLEQSSEDVKNEYELLVAFIIEVDRSIVAKQFYTINYHQKPVNKSLLYHLSGEFSDELNEITFLHEAVKILNEIEYSPFFKRIKMLGIIPKDLEPEEKEKMTISQAFLIDYLKRTIVKSAKGSIYTPIFLYYFKNKDLQIEIIRFLIKYFEAIKGLKPHDWDNPQESIICKTIGVGAFIRVLHFIFVKIFIDKFNEQPDKIKGLKVNDLKSIMEGIEDIDFSKEGQFGGIASAGSLNKLKENIIEKVDYLEGTTYADFLSNFKESYLNKFKKWMHDNI